MAGASCDELLRLMLRRSSQGQQEEVLTSKGRMLIGGEYGASTIPETNQRNFHQTSKVARKERIGMVVATCN